MPYAPTYNPQTSAPQGPTTRFQAFDNGASQVAEAASRFGQTLQRAAGQEAEIQDVHNETFARKKALELQQTVSQMWVEYSQLEGENAVVEGQRIRDNIAELQKDAAKQMGNERQKRYFEAFSQDFLSRADTNVVEHVAGQAKVMQIATAEAEIVEASRLTAGSYLDLNRHVKDIASVREAAKRLGQLRGITGAALQEFVFNQVSQAHGLAFEQMAAQGDMVADEREGYLEQFRAQMTPDVLAKATQNVESLRQEEWAYAKTNEIFSSISSATSSPAPEGSGGQGATVERQHPVGGTVTHRDADHMKRGSRGLDIAGNAGAAIKPSAAGTVIEAGRGETGGNYIRIKHPDGYVTSYMHMSGPSPYSVGDEVTPSTVIGTVGMTGRASGPHLHFEVKDPSGAQVDPEKYLKGATVVGTPEEPRIHDVGAYYAEVDRQYAAGEINFAQAERIRTEIDKRVARDSKALAARENAANTAAEEWLAENLDDFTDFSQMPEAIRSQLTPALTIRYKGMAAQNAKALAVTKADPQAEMFLMGLKAVDPENFMALNLSEYAPNLSQKRFAELQRQQAEMRKKREQGIVEWSPASGIRTGFNLMSSLDGVKYSDQEKARVLVLMEEFANRRFKEVKGELTEADYQEAYRYATQEIATRTNFLGINTGRSSNQRFRLDDEVERAATSTNEARLERDRKRQQARDTTSARSAFFRRYGRYPSEYELAEIMNEVGAQ